MNILIVDTPITLTVELETEQAPCIGCKHLLIADEVGPSLCTVYPADKLSGQLIEDCTRLGWREE